MISRPTAVVMLFDQKSANRPDRAKLAELKRVPHNASDIVRYCVRLKLLPSPYAPALDVPWYITRGGEVGAVAFQNFELDDLPGMSRELERDALMASTSLSSPWIHGCISLDVSPEDFEGNPDDLLDMGHALMKMFGVDENRYMLTVHLDSGKIHVHFFYSRVDCEGQLRERDRKMPKFMAEEATALLAYQFGFSLEPHHLSRGTPEGVVDLASGKLVRTADFVEVRAGMKSRNKARIKTSRNELLTLALVARHEAHDLKEFRRLLAPHGITYEKLGSGAEFFDINGGRFKASDVDRRFTPTHMFAGGLLIDFDETPEDLVREADRVRANAKLARDIGEHARMASANSEGKPHPSVKTPSKHIDENAEITRLLADREVGDLSCTEGEKRWDKAVAAALKSKPGRPPKSPIVPDWPANTKFDGVLGPGKGARRCIKFPEPAYETRERAYQTEIWRDGSLIASIRYSQMAIISTRDEDLRQALLAANRAWGAVEIYGKPKFKKKMAKLAVEMGIPVSNPELHDGMAKLLKAMAPAAKTPLASKSVGHLQDHSPPVVVPALQTSRSVSEPEHERETVKSERFEHRQGSAVDQKTSSKVHASQVFNREILTSIQSGNWPIRADPSDHTRWTLYPRDMAAFLVEPENLNGEATQAGLGKLFDAQQQDLISLIAAIKAGKIKVIAKTDMMGRESIKLQVPSGSSLEPVYQRSALHPDFFSLMKTASMAASEADQPSSEERIAIAPYLDDDSDGASPGTAPNVDVPDVVAKQISAPIAVEDIKTVGDRKAAPVYIGKPLQPEIDQPAEPAKESSIISGDPIEPHPWAMTADERREFLKPRSFPYPPSPPVKVSSSVATPGAEGAPTAADLLQALNKDAKTSVLSDVKENQQTQRIADPAEEAAKAAELGKTK